MDAVTITKNSAGKWRAWCESCQDGYQGGKITATKWATKHEEEDRHRERAARWEG